ncbi:MAG: hypothetical protein Q8N88_03380, partial [Nanoarchaeota archaeon]|nr:hypothetical protein [Nanoarchaeota archaeon]
TTAYRIKKNYLLPLFYTPQDIILSKRIQDLPQIVSQPDYQIRSVIYFQNQNKEKGNTLEKSPNKLKRNPIIEFKKVNSTKYRVTVHQAKDSFPLISSENFHKGWKGYLVKSEILNSKFKTNLKSQIINYKILEGNEEDQANKDELAEFIEKGWISTLGDLKENKIEHKKWEGNRGELDYIEKYQIDFISKNFQNTIQNDNLSSGPFYETWLAKNDNQFSIFNLQLNKNVFQIPDDKHLIANGYANSWIIDSDSICQNNDQCTKNPDGSYDFELIMEFWPQRLFYIGLFISGTTLLTCASYIIWDWQRRKKSLTKTKSKDGK